MRFAWFIPAHQRLAALLARVEDSHSEYGHWPLCEMSTNCPPT